MANILELIWLEPDDAADEGATQLDLQRLSSLREKAQQSSWKEHLEPHNKLWWQQQERKQPADIADDQLQPNRSALCQQGYPP